MYRYVSSFSIFFLCCCLDLICTMPFFKYNIIVVSPVIIKHVLEQNSNYTIVSPNNTQTQRENLNEADEVRQPLGFHLIRHTASRLYFRNVHKLTVQGYNINIYVIRIKFLHNLCLFLFQKTNICPYFIISFARLRHMIFIIH